MFKISQYDFTLIAIEKIKLPDHPGSTIRGGLGHALRELVCSTKNNDCKKCLLSNQCAYTQIFEPSMSDMEKEQITNRFSTKPRPYILEPRINGKTEYYPGEHIHFTIRLFGSTNRFLPYLLVAIQNLGKTGIGVERGKFVLSEVWNINELVGKAERIYSEYANIVTNPFIELDWDHVLEFQKHLPSDKIRLKILTPMLLKANKAWVKKLEFEYLMRNILRRLSSLNVFYGTDVPSINYPELLKQSKEIQLTKDRTSWRNWTRYSSRQDQQVEMYGLLGEVYYTGNLKPFLPYLILGQYCYVGKNTVFGQGNYKIIKL
ncbi:MAG: CRISPR system precrRNA processing endoribonuclease RAMP protein Cas6 [Halanaerobiales bacterium]|nr:CRISPR system precrRNA processing endoribonuclease RAMP protein Cas6 [Halanaerobiales bacterium]